MRVCPRHQSLIGKGALDGEELFTIEGSKNWRSTPGQPEEREKWRKNASKHDSAGELNLRFC